MDDSTPSLSPVFPAQNQDLRYAILMLIFSMFTANAIVAGGFHLGFSLGTLVIVMTTLIYLRKQLHWSFYGALHLIGVISTACLFAYSDDRAMRFFLFFLLLLTWHQCLSVLLGVGFRNTGSVSSLLDTAAVTFRYPFQNLGRHLSGLSYAYDGETVVRRKTGGVLLGLAISIPVLSIILPLLVASDAAFEGLISKTIFSNLGLLVETLALGALLFLPLYGRGISLSLLQKPQAKESTYKGSISPLTLNTLLILVSFFYFLYLISQLAYFFSAFSGILPEGYTPAQYARRGFFEMCILCGMNLALIAFSAGLVKRSGNRIPTLTKFLNLFVCLFSLVLVAASGSKMVLYISSFGLTRLRILTSMFMLCLGISIICVGIWLFLPKFPYMKIIVVAVLLTSGITAWADVDTQVARYNVKAYKTGVLSSIDMSALTDLSAGSAIYIADLLNDPDPEVADYARSILANRLYRYHTQYNEDGTSYLTPVDFRSWCKKTDEERAVLEPLLPLLVNYYG